MEGAWDENEERAGEKKELDSDAVNDEIWQGEKVQDGVVESSGGGGDEGGLLLPSTSDEGHDAEEPKAKVEGPVLQQAEDDEPQTFANISTVQRATDTKPAKRQLRGMTTMLDEEDIRTMPKEEIEESWVKIALGLREDLSKKCVLISSSSLRSVSSELSKDIAWRGRRDSSCDYGGAGYTTAGMCEHYRRGVSISMSSIGIPKI